jgi:hypothetical protein
MELLKLQRPDDENHFTSRVMTGHNDGDETSTQIMGRGSLRRDVKLVTDCCRQVHDLERANTCLDSIRHLLHRSATQYRAVEATFADGSNNHCRAGTCTSSEGSTIVVNNATSRKACGSIEPTCQRCHRH